ncbi:TetR/AcrR family transcriptional regulator [Lysinibacillus sp. KU-BSD001]|uniref:TetR/AcrR family transcriptional regulator n=1 Tax=Lysinibacillus sp. KU-BSD001 TaxID=3141328 RepID=UPI0036E3E230
MAKPNVISKGDLIHFAKACLVEKGIEKFTLRAVAEVAGVTQGTIYYHFKTKEQLLLYVVQDICEKSWTEISQQQNQSILSQAIKSAQSRCSHDSFYHKLFLTLMVSSFHNEKIRDSLAEMMLLENKAMSENVSKLWANSPIQGISLETWGILLNALVDGLALQALLEKDFPVENVYKDVEKLFHRLSELVDEEGK